MIIVDANLLIYAVNRDSLFHSAAKRWLETSLSGPEYVGLSWVVILAFLRLTTRPGISQHPLSVETALAVLDAWLAQPTVLVVHPTSRHSSVLRGLLAPLGTGGNMTTDAHLAALSIEHGATLCSTDNDFAKFPRVRFVNPLL